MIYETLTSELEEGGDNTESTDDETPKPEGEGNTEEESSL